MEHTHEAWVFFRNCLNKNSDTVDFAFSRISVCTAASSFCGLISGDFLSPKNYFSILEITSWCFRVEHRAPQLPANPQLGGGGGEGGRGGGGGGGAQRREDAAKFPFVLSLHFYHPGTAGTDSTFHFCISLNHVKTRSTWFGLADIIGSCETTC